MLGWSGRGFTQDGEREFLTGFRCSSLSGCTNPAATADWRWSDGDWRNTYAAWAVGQPDARSQHCAVGTSYCRPLHESEGEALALRFSVWVHRLLATGGSRTAKVVG